jgi:hypothetical protein
LSYLSARKRERAVGNTAITDAKLDWLPVFWKKRDSRREGENSHSRAILKNKSTSRLVDGFSGGEHVLRRVQFNVTYVPEPNIRVIPT